MPHITLLIADRGEIACHIIRSAKALGLRCVAVHFEADASTRHVRLADEAIAIGTSLVTQSYLDIAQLVNAAKETGATLVYPGYGFLPASYKFARICSTVCITFVRSSSEAMESMGDKETARRAARDVVVLVLPGSTKLDVADVDRLVVEAGKIGFPLLVKGGAGGGGIDTRIVEKPANLGPAALATSVMVANAFGDGAIYPERYIRYARHIEVQLFGLVWNTPLPFPTVTAPCNATVGKCWRRLPHPMFLKPPAQAWYGPRSGWLAHASTKAPARSSSFSMTTTGTSTSSK
jgi:acetyl/propionyl-CoA carboxylase alpha subunit